MKIQYPGIDRALRSDIDNMGLVVKTMALAHRALDGRQYFHELAEELAHELDYSREGRLAREFARASAGMPDIVIPQIVDERTSTRVLTMERIPGQTLKTFLASQSDERRAAPRLGSADSRHPRLVPRRRHRPRGSAPGKLHGDARRQAGRARLRQREALQPRVLRGPPRRVQLVLEQQPIDVLDLARRVGFTVELRDDEARPLLEEMIDIAGRALRTDDYDYAHDTMAPDSRKLFARHAAQFLKIRPPAEGVMFFRAFGGLQQNLRLLGARGDFRPFYQSLLPLLD